MAPAFIGEQGLSSTQTRVGAAAPTTLFGPRRRPRQASRRRYPQPPYGTVIENEVARNPARVQEVPGHVRMAREHQHLTVGAQLRKHPGRRPRPLRIEVHQHVIEDHRKRLRAVQILFTRPHSASTAAAASRSSAGGCCGSRPARPGRRCGSAPRSVPPPWSSAPR